MERKQRAGAGWREALLEALARGASYSAAAREAGIDPSSVHRVRQRDPAFADACLRARETGSAALTESAPVLAPDEVVRDSKSGQPRVQRAGPGRWSTGKENQFIEQLAATCNVSAACRAVGVSNVAVYERRKRSPTFAQAWRDALDHGYHRLEALLLGTATAVLEGEGARCESADIGDDADAVDTVGDATGDAAGDTAVGSAGEPTFVAPMSVDQAITVWRMHQASVTGEGRRPRHDWRRVPASLEEIQAEVLRRVRAVSRGVGEVGEVSGAEG